MFQDLKPYADYRDTESPWLRRVPTHWSMPRMKTVVREASNKGYPNEPLLAATQSRGVILKDQYETRTVEATKSLETLKLVRVDDFVISLRSFQGGIERAYAQGIISPAYTILQARPKTSRDYFTLLFKSRPFIDALRLAVTGIREGQNIEYPRLAREPIVVPPVEEQKAIVMYLAHAYQRIKEAIASKRRLIAVLGEHRRHMVDQLVSRGEGEHGDYIETGSMWLSKIPSGWRYVPVKRVISNGPTNGVSPQVSESGDLKTLSLAAVRNGRVSGSLGVTKYVTRASVQAVDSFRLREGDILIVRGNGRLQLVGQPGLVSADLADREFIYPDLLIRVRVNDLMDERYFVHAFSGRAARAQIETAARTAVGTFKVSGEDIKSVLVPLPPLAEQRAIVEKIDQTTAALDATASAAVREIELLEEFRVRLTADVVTGQLDVRSAAAELPTINLADALAVSAGAADVDNEETVDEASMEDE